MNFLPEHIGDWVVTNIIRHTHSALEEFNGQMSALARVKQNPILLTGAEV